MKLAARLMCVVLAVVMLMTAIGSYFSVRRAFERFADRQQQLARETAKATNDRLVEAWQQQGADGLQRAVTSLTVPAAGHRIRWVWLEKQRLADGRSRTTVVEQIRVSGGGAVSDTITDQHGKRHLQTIYPIDLGDGPKGGIEVTGSLETLEEETRETIIISLTSLGVMALVSFGFVYFAGVRWVAQPLEQLIAKTERIGQGDFSEPLPVRGTDELGQLASALNAMSARLAEQQEQIQNEATARLAALEQLRHVDRLKTVGRLAAGLAHELGTPLNVVAGRAGLIASGKLSQADVQKSAETIKSEADRITGIIRQLLDFARRSSPRHGTADLPDVVRATTSLLAPLADKHHVSFNVVASESPLIVEGDASQIQQVLTNLVVNAIHSMPEGGTITIQLDIAERPSPPPKSERDEKTYIRIDVKDEGKGIPAAEVPHIFEPFFTTKDVGEGTGLGLSIAYGIVEEHGGWFEVKSEPDRGTCFTFFLPATEVTAPIGPTASGTNTDSGVERVRENPDRR